MRSVQLFTYLRKDVSVLCFRKYGEQDTGLNCIRKKRKRKWRYIFFIQVYDLFQDNISLYEEWADFILKSLLNEYGVKDGLVLRSQCGTGALRSLGSA